MATTPILLDSHVTVDQHSARSLPLAAELTRAFGALAADAEASRRSRRCGPRSRPGG
jgi:hypothetical protein